MQLSPISSRDGYSLIELLVVIVILGIIATVAVKSLTGVNDAVRIEETRQELGQLALAIAGWPELVSGGQRTDYGYVGDVGSLPVNLDALVQNPGGYSTWDGPYIHDDFYSLAGGSETEFQLDAWGKAYGYSGGMTISSTGGGSTLSREIANSSGDLLANVVSAVITDLDGSPPGAVYKDSVKFLLTHPDGTGGTITRSGFPRADGFLAFNSVPIGLHTLAVVYLPTNDTIRRLVNVDPGSDHYAAIQYYDDVW